MLSKVVLGEADAAIVYRTDAIHAGRRVRVVPIDPAVAVVARYPVAVVRQSREPEVARAFVEFVGQPEARAIFSAHGFTECPP